MIYAVTISVDIPNLSVNAATGTKIMVERSHQLAVKGEEGRGVLTCGKASKFQIKCQLKQQVGVMPEAACCSGNHKSVFAYDSSHLVKKLPEYLVRSYHYIILSANHGSSERSDGEKMT